MLKHVDLSACSLQCGSEKNYLSADVFANCKLESVILPSTLRVIGEHAFMKCTNLKTINFGDNSELEEIKA